MLSQDLGGDEYMPDSFSPYADHCSLPEENAFCLRAGDSRANQQPGILSMQTLWVREHNRIARRLACINPHWEDEELFLVTNAAHFVLPKVMADANTESLKQPLIKGVKWSAVRKLP
ncbi:hypothetical protein HPB50_018800 [Hyalomma asiaticum]|uniref:Uncharacterized protein n=1 Tax=Hyalomma asiaticum TaxID=266040 RepID=A0ACB7RJH7_HYAAI|nr:hypothetical protein HPB50_018800 [Hyalomma asiaticum]